MILVTRPKNQAQETARKLKAQGYKILLEPLFSIKIAKPESYNFSAQKLQAVILSSSNAVDYLRNLNLPRDLLILTIGRKTAAAVEAEGFNKIIIANNSATSLLEMAKKNLDQEQGLILYLSGKTITLDIAAQLKKLGYNSQKIIAYHTQPKKSLSGGAVAKIKSGAVSGVLIYSKNTATILSKLASKHNLLEYFDAIELLCLSSNIATHCKALGFTRVGNINKIIKKYD